jgi:hypothetical protein
MSIHTGKAKDKARRLGGWAGDPRAGDLWKLSKRELAELALRLGALTTDNADDIDLALKAVNSERAALKLNGII